MACVGTKKLEEDVADDVGLASSHAYSLLAVREVTLGVVLWMDMYVDVRPLFKSLREVN
jgi:hypothetical protein